MAAGTRPPRVTAMTLRHGPRSRSRQASAREWRCNSSHETGNVLVNCCGAVMPHDSASDERRLAAHRQRTKMRTSLLWTSPLVVAESVTRSAGRPILVSDRITFSALCFDAFELTATWAAVPELGATATSSNVADGLRSSARLTAV